MVPLRGDFKMCKNWNMSEKTVPILFVGDGFLSLCITSYLPFRPTLLGDFPACCGRRNASPTPLQIENLAENSVSILFVGDGFPVPLHIGLFTASPNPFGRFFRLLREAKRLPYAPTNSNLSFCCVNPINTLSILYYLLSTPAFPPNEKSSPTLAGWGVSM